MASNIKQTSAPSQESILREIKATVVSLNDKIQKLEASVINTKPMADASSIETQRPNDVILTKGVVLRLMKVGQTTLARWRYKGLLKFYPKSSREIVYKYQDLMDALRAGRLASRDFDQYAAIKRLSEWYEDNVGSTFSATIQPI